MTVKSKKKKKKWPWVLGSIALVIICVVLFMNHQMSSMRSQLSQNLSTTKLKKTTLEDSISASGKIASASSVSVTSSLNYIVNTVNVKVGDSVSKGDVLAVFDTTELKNSVEDAQKSYDAAKKQFDLKIVQSKQSLEDAQNNVSDAKTNLTKAKENYADALGDKAGSSNYKTRYNEAEEKDQATMTAKQTLSTSESNLTQAQNNYDNTVANDTTTNSKSQLQTAKDNLAKATITAPSDGIVSAVNVTAGNTPSGGSSATGTGTGTGSGNSLFTIQSSSNFIVNASVADYDVIQLSIDKKIGITVDSTSETLAGKILAISPVANSSGNYDITASIENPTAKNLRVGMDVTVKIVLEKKDNIYTVSVDSIVDQNDKKYVVSLDTSDPKNMKRTYIEVTTGMKTDYYAEISGVNLKDGLNILNDPLNKLKTDQTGGFPSGGFPGGGIAGGK